MLTFALLGKTQLIIEELMMKLIKSVNNIVNSLIMNTGC